MGNIASIIIIADDRMIFPFIRINKKIGGVCEYIGLAYTDYEVSGVVCLIEFGTDKELVSEIVTYEIY